MGNIVEDVDMHCQWLPAMRITEMATSGVNHDDRTAPQPESISSPASVGLVAFLVLAFSADATMQMIRRTYTCTLYNLWQVILR